LFEKSTPTNILPLFSVNLGQKSLRESFFLKLGRKIGFLQSFSNNFRIGER